MKSSKRWSVPLALWLAASGGVACGREVTGGEREQPGQSLPSTNPGDAVEGDSALLTTPYPAGRWRLALPQELDGSVLWGAHILIAHRDATARLASFDTRDWAPSDGLPDRSRRDAARLAESVARRAAAAPDTFAELARELSDDTASKDMGGFFGGNSAFQFAQWPELLDAFAALGIDEVSRVVETEFGFHVFMRQLPPAEQVVSGAHIVIGHDGAPWLHGLLARHPIASRSRAEAFAIAERLYQRLEANADDFASVVQEFSDHQDALRGGDFGEWSTREPTAFSREVQVLQRLEVGRIAPPLDSPYGVQIILRTPHRERQRLGMEAIIRMFDSSASDDDPESRTNVLREMNQLAERLPFEPPLFAQVRASYCCTGSMTWVEGRADTPEEVELKRLAIGAISPRVVEGSTRALLVRRVEPSVLPATQVTNELPRPEAPSTEYFLTSYGSPELLGTIEARAASELALDRDTADALRRAHARVAEQLVSGEGDDVRLAAFRRFQEDTATLLGRERFDRYEKVIEHVLAERLMRLRRPGHNRDRETGAPILGWPRLWDD